MQPKVFIIILNWNNWPDVKECLESLKNNDYPNYEVVIVDNDSKEKPQASDGVKVIYNNKNLGFSGGNNVGIKYALKQDTDYILLLNDDTIVTPDFLSKMVKAAESDSKIGMVGSKIYFYKDRNKLWFAGGIINWLYNKGEMKGYNEIDKGQYDQPDIQESSYLTGCCLLVKRMVIEKIGLLPEEYFAYYEDTDWSLAAQKAGFKTVFVPKARIWHKGSKSSREFSKPYIYYHVRNGLIFASKYAPWYIKPIIHLDIVWRIIKQIVKLVFISQKRIWAKVILLGIKDFYFKKWGKNDNWY
ncbi:MAG: glycosyltransferase family 2 protein [Patescibacteria group bacterium]